MKKIVLKLYEFDELSKDSQEGNLWLIPKISL